MRLFKGISAIAFSILALASFNASADTMVVASGTCYSYGCATPSQNCNNQGGSFNYNSSNNQYTCTVTYTPPPQQSWVVIASGTCYSYGCATPSQYCNTQGGSFTYDPSTSQYTCKKLM
ncbi:MAG: hypothetical protein V4660_09000 [Pseudomonadota bacterium]